MGTPIYSQLSYKYSISVYKCLEVISISRSLSRDMVDILSWGTRGLNWTEFSFHWLFFQMTVTRTLKKKKKKNWTWNTLKGGFIPSEPQETVTASLHLATGEAGSRKNISQDPRTCSTHSDPSDFILFIYKMKGFPRWLSGKESACQCRRHMKCGFHL